MENICLECGRPANYIVNDVSPACKNHAEEAHFQGYIVRELTLKDLTKGEDNERNQV